MKLSVKRKAFCVLCCMALLLSTVTVKAAQDPVEGGDGEPITWGITYSDGKGGSVFPDQSKLVKDGEKTPIYMPDEGVYPGYEFDGWEPELQQYVDCDMKYVAKWKPVAGADENTDSNTDSNSNTDDSSDAEQDDIDSSTVSQQENEQAAKKNAKKNAVTYDDDSSDATDQGLVDDTGSGKENSYADDVDSGDMNTPVVGGILVLCIILVGGLVFLLKRQNRSE